MLIRLAPRAMALAAATAILTLCAQAEPAPLPEPKLPPMPSLEGPEATGDMARPPGAARPGPTKATETKSRPPGDRPTAAAARAGKTAGRIPPKRARVTRPKRPPAAHIKRSNGPRAIKGRAPPRPNARKTRHR